MVAKWQNWMPFYIDAFMGSPAVQAMHPTARIGYLCLLARSWQTEDCTIPADDWLTLSEMSGIGDELWKIYGDRILKKFNTVPGTSRLRNAVLYEKWKEAKRIFDSRRAAAEQTNKARPTPLQRIAPKDDRLRARRTVTVMVKNKIIPPANSMTCIDCGHIWSKGERRHEYDHHLGYDPAHFADVESVCTTCHTRREEQRGKRWTSPTDTVTAREPSRSADTRTGTVTGTETGTGERLPPTPTATVTVDEFNQDPLETIPEGLAPTQYASFVTQELHIAAGYALTVKIGDAIEILAEEEACGLPDATRRILDRMRAAQAAGPVKWLFWLEDGNWKAPAAPFSIGIEDPE
jgi:hypothetical protein